MNCRLCLKKCAEENFISLFENDFELSLTKLIVKYMHLEIKQNDDFSTFVCQKCAQHLEEFDCFCELVEQCQLQLIMNQDATPSALESDEQDFDFIKPDLTDNEEYNEIQEFENDFVTNEIVDAVDFMPHFNTDASGVNELDSNELIARFVNLNCVVCGVQTATFNALKIHFRDLHNVPSGYAICCGNKYTHSNKLLDHAKTHLDPAFFKCDLCSKTFKTRQNLKGHKNAHLFASLPEENRTCVVCNQIFTSYDVLKAHMYKSHKGIKPFTCKVCSREFKLEFAYKNHIAHLCSKIDDFSDLDDRTCLVCKRIFKSSNVLRVHMHNLHKNVRPFECDKCGKKFILKHSFDRHLKLLGKCISSVNKVKIDDNKSSVQEINMEENFCVICKKFYKNYRVLKSHVYRNHPNIKNFKCQFCKIAFLFKHLLKRHIVKAHHQEM